MAVVSSTFSTTAGTTSDKTTKSERVYPLLHRPSPKYYVPKDERDETRTVFHMDQTTLGQATRLSRNSRTCPTRELNFLHSQWNAHKSPYRKIRHISNLFTSAPFQRLFFPELVSITAVAGCLTYYNVFVDGHTLLGMSTSSFAGATTAIGLLAGFRLNTSYGRYTEGRKLWSTVNSATRNLARQTLMWIASPTARTRILRLCQAYPIALMFHLSDKGCYHNMKRKSEPGEGTFQERVQAEFEAELWDVYGKHIVEKVPSGHPLQNDFERICKVQAQKGGNVPLEVITCMSETIASTMDGEGGEKRNLTSPIMVRELDGQVQLLTTMLGSCERMVKTPLPTGFTRHSSRLLFIWSNCLPFALYPLVGPLGTAPTALLTAYAVLGIEDISVQLEEPFDILPLRQYSDSMYEGINAIEKSYQQTST